jgi:hypothetical protein
VEEVKFIALCANSMMLISLTAFASDHSVKTAYCWQETKDSWVLHLFKPLINTQGGTSFSEMSLEGKVLQKVRLRRFFPNSELVFEYTFDPAGRLNGLHGSVSVLGQWLAEANLFPDADGKVGSYHVVYRRSHVRINTPDNADSYVGRLDEVPIYRTIESVPCAVMLKEVEGINATQK